MWGATNCQCSIALDMLEGTSLTEHHDVLDPQYMTQQQCYNLETLKMCTFGRAVRFACCTGCGQYLWTPTPLATTPQPKAPAAAMWQGTVQSPKLCRLVASTIPALPHSAETPVQSCLLVLPGKRLPPSHLILQGMPVPQGQSLQWVRPCFALHVCVQRRWQGTAERVI